MEKFVAYNPTKLFFGSKCVSSMSKYLPSLGSKALIITGKHSAKKIGVFDDVISQLRQANISFVEYSGIKPNPVVDDVQKAIELGRSENVEMVIAIGGGSVIDSAKIIALCIPQNHHPWKVMKGIQKPVKALPLVTVLTLAATGTEMNQFAVLQNDETHEKLGFGSPLIFPTMSFCDPTYTLTVSKEYTAWGLVDIVAHCLEAYFGNGQAYLSDKIVVSILKEVIEIGDQLLIDLKNYELRERMMWASTCALNGITLHGRKSGDWGVHDVAHHLSALFDIPHGASLSVVYPAWLKLFKKPLSERISWLGNEVFGVKNANATIKKLELLFMFWNCPINLSMLQLKPKQIDEFIALLRQHKPTGMIQPITEEQLVELVELMK
ncbi:MAG: iron-containing alcohol dehydrogenase [Bacteroidales bacterium]|nr:iron-containing alcohol dehydrogenase [Bacteroidales bacterium]